MEPNRELLTSDGGNDGPGGGLEVSRIARRAAPIGPVGDSGIRSRSSGRFARGIRFWLRTTGVEATVRLLGWAIVSGTDALSTAIGSVFLPTHERRQRQAGSLQRALERVVAVLGQLKGAFAKAGQFAAIRHDLLPASTVAALAGLRDRVPPLPWPEIHDQLTREFGRPIDQIFASIANQPKGEAAIAQAHRARLPDGAEVVVKIQYPWIEDALASDLRILRCLGRGLVRSTGRSSGEVDFDRFFDEFAVGLASELDFLDEARSAAEIARNLSDLRDVIVPAVYPELTTRRVLTMAFHPCVSIADQAALDALGVQRAAIVATLARAYSKQVFVDGLFHADPHPGNLFVLADAAAGSSPRILFVDFGLCRRLSTELRRAMRAGLYAVLQRDLDSFVARMQDMRMIAPGAEVPVRAAVARMFDRLATAGGGTGALGASTRGVLALKDEAKQLLRETPGLQLPNDLLLYAKTLSYLFALGESLDPGADLMKISLPYLLRFLAEREPDVEASC
jgi:ubiquinone biosynthesis protein